MNFKSTALFLSLIIMTGLTSCHQQSSSHYFKNGSAKYELKNFQGAIVDLNRAIELDAKYAEAYYLRALCYSNLDESNLAAPDFDRAISIKANFKDAYFNRAFYIFQENGEYEKAMEDYNTFLGLHPTKYVAFALNNRAFSEFKLGMYTEALKDIDQSIKKNSTNSLAFKNQALVLFSLDSLDAACGSYDKAIQLGYVPEEDEPLLDSLNLHCNQ